MEIYIILRIIYYMETTYYVIPIIQHTSCFPPNQPSRTAAAVVVSYHSEWWITAGGPAGLLGDDFRNRVGSYVSRLL